MYNSSDTDITTATSVASCIQQFVVRRVYSYQPDITLTPDSTSKLPAVNNIVSPLTTVNISEFVTNEINLTGASHPYNGDSYYSGIYYYEKGYQGPVPPATVGTLTPSVGVETQAFLISTTPPGNNQVASSNNGIAPGATPLVSAASFTVPAGTPDGTQICFFGYVSPAARSDISVSTPDTLTRSSGVFPLAGERITTGSVGVYSGGNKQSDTSVPGHDHCMEVNSSRNLNIGVQGDVHAGGGISGSACNGTTPSGASQYIYGTGRSSTYSEYIGSSSGAISGFNTGGSRINSSLTFGNSGATGGSYGIVCRPDFATAVATAESTIQTISGVSCGTAIDINTCANANITGQQGIITVPTNTTLCGDSAIALTKQVTIIAHGDINIGGTSCSGIGTSNLLVNPSSTTANIQNLPSLAIVADNISISKDTLQIDGILVANNTINTCSEHNAGYTQDCWTGTLTVNGAMYANAFNFGRTGGTCQSCDPSTEQLNVSPLPFLNPPPGFSILSGSAQSLPQYLGEAPPLY